MADEEPRIDGDPSSRRPSHCTERMPKSQAAPATSASSGIPSTQGQHAPHVVGRRWDLSGATVKPQFPPSTVVTPWSDEGSGAPGPTTTACAEMGVGVDEARGYHALPLASMTSPSGARRWVRSRRPGRRQRRLLLGDGGPPVPSRTVPALILRSCIVYSPWKV